MSDVEYETAGGVATVTLNRPGSLNAIDRSVHDGLVESCARAQTDPDVRVVVLQGRGRAFSAGGDLRAVAAGQDVGDPADLAAALGGLSMPVVASVHGYCLGQAFELVQSSDLVVAEAGAQFGEVEIQHGWAPPIPITARMLTPRHASEVLLLGEIFGVEDALRMGIVNRVAAEGELAGALSRIVDRLVSLEPRVLAANKQQIRSWARLV